jgi:predicted O-methyltransferase YrrM
MSRIKAIARKVVPKPVRNAIRYVLSEDYRDRLFFEHDRQVGQRVFALTGGVVVGGPFKGLQYVSTARGSSIGPKLLGTYELELREIVEGIIARGYRTVINIGAGEGYYSVGLAKRMPQTRFICFDADPSNQEQIRTLAKLNGVDAQLDVRGFCDDAALNAALGDAQDVLVLCDIEGAEVEVLRPDAVAGLRRVDLLVEMHDIVRKGCSPTLKKRFETTHKIEVIATRKRQAPEFPAGVPAGSDRERREFMDEGRGSTPMTFFWMRPLQG